MLPLVIVVASVEPVKLSLGINTPLSLAVTSNWAEELGVSVPIPTWE